MLKILFSALLSVCLAAPALAQSQAANGTIEGTVFDSSGGVLPGATVTLTNVDTGAERVVISNDKGLYRAPLLTLGTYKVVAELQGFKKAEQFSYKAADGTTTLYGQISFPSNFDPAKKYPVLVPVYGGPVAFGNIPTESFAGPNSTAEYGFLVVSVMYRGVPGTGKRAADALYLKLGQTEMDDMAEGVKALWTRPYVDKARVGIYGTSYGGYTSAMEIVRHPEVFAAASASSPPTDWRNYDTIYTERYMWIPDENKSGYEAGSVMTYARNLKGRLLLYYGTADNNVHPSNSLQLIRALQLAGKNFELQVGPDQPHSGVDNRRMMEFFIENLVVHPERLMAPGDR